MNYQQKDASVIANTYRRFPVTLISGNGSVVTDENGKEYIDLGSGIAVTSFGIGDSVWKNAVTEQINKIQHTSNLYYSEPCIELAELLCSRTGMKKVFFSNSGTEANECAIKAARKFGETEFGITDPVIVTLENSFHGRTLGTLAATGQDHFHEHFGPLPNGFCSVKVGDTEALRALCEQKNTVAVMMECIQGEGGVLPLPQEFMEQAVAIAHENNCLVIIDEVQTGNGRTGALYAYMNYGITPDIVSTAKGLAGGLPLGATLLGEKVQSVFSYGDHGSTFGGNPVCCAAALSVLSRLDDDFLLSVRKKGAFLTEHLQNAKGITSISGMGLMLGLETQAPAPDIVAEGIRRGILCLTAKSKVRLLPALNIPMPLLQKAVTILKEICEGE